MKNNNDYKKSATMDEFTIGVRMDGSIEVLIDGKPFHGNVRGLLRDEIARRLNFDVDPNWNTQQLGSKLIDYINQYRDTRSEYESSSDRYYKMLRNRLDGLIDTAKRRGITEFGWHDPIPDDDDDDAKDAFNDIGFWFTYWDDRVENWKGYRFVLEGKYLYCTLADNEYEELCDDVYLVFSIGDQSVDCLDDMIRMIERDLK